MPEGHGAVHELLMIAAGVLVVVTGVAAIAVDALMRRGLLGPPDRVFRGETLLVVPLVSASLGAAAIHFSVIGEHFQEWWAFGLSFVAAAWFQAWWAVVFALRPARAVAAAGGIVNAAIVVVWIVSRTVGLPFGPDAGKPEAVGFADVLTTALEVVLVAGLLPMALTYGRRTLDSLRMEVGSAIMAGTAWSVAVVLATAIALATVSAGGHAH